MDELTSEFLVETNESLDALDLDFVTLEKNPGDMEIINNIFRVMHTIKGTCGFLGLQRLEKLAHAAENIMDKLREGAFEASPEIVSLILEANDRIKGIIEELEETGEEPAGEDSDLTDRLNQCAEQGGISGGDSAPTPASEDVVAAEETPAAAAPEATEEPKADAPVVNKTPDLDEAIDFEPVKASYAGGAESEAVTAEKEAINKTPDLDEAIDFEPVKASYTGDDAPVPVAADNAPAKEDMPEQAKQEAVKKGLEAAEEGAAAKQKAAPATQSIRVGIDVLENLMQMVGELVLTRNQLMQLMRSAEGMSGEFNTPLQRLNHITTELQEGVMQTRMQPIGNAWAKFPRLVRDLAMDLDKKIELKMVGADTELDRQMLEAIKDPLTHMVRNSADHGVEGPEERREAGKSDTGTVTLSAYHEGGHIIIKISDDGRGINVEKVKAKAIENGLASEADMAAMSDKQIYQFIFKPGFSTAEEVTAVSGRGVGMDVVVSNIEKIGGNVELNSRFGKGSEFVIKLPLTLAIMPVLLVQCGEENFAIPQIRVSEIVRADEKSGDGHVIETINKARVLRIRGRLLPLISVADTLKLARDSMAVNDNADADDDEAAEAPPPQLATEPFVVVCEIGSQSVGLLVDKVFHTEEIVVKPISPIMKDLEVYSGCTILGDGSVIMILDPNGIVKVNGNATIGEDAKSEQEEEHVRERERLVNFLTFKAWSNAPKAVPLELVSRLEEIDASTIEWSGNQRVVQYRGTLMRLTCVNPDNPLPAEGTLEVVVFADEDKVLGLVVEEILDIVKQRMDKVSHTSEQGLIGSLVIDGQTMDMIDISYCFQQAFGDWLGHDEAKPLSGMDGGHHILLVDDSPFFRKFMKPMLSVAGYEVTTAEDAYTALELLQDPDNYYDLIVSDIDMPGMNGIEFVKTCKQDSKLAMLPYVALSSHSAKDLGDYKSHGFSAFVNKTERDTLIEVINGILLGSDDSTEAVG